MTMTTMGVTMTAMGMAGMTWQQQQKKKEGDNEIIMADIKTLEQEEERMEEENIHDIKDKTHERRVLLKELSEEKSFRESFDKTNNTSDIINCQERKASLRKGSFKSQRLEVPVTERS